MMDVPNVQPHCVCVAVFRKFSSDSSLSAHSSLSVAMLTVASAFHTHQIHQIHQIHLDICKLYPIFSEKEVTWSVVVVESLVCAW